MSETTTNKQTGAALGEPTQAAGAADDITTRLRPIFTEEGLARIQGSRVLVIGLGGVGSSCVEALARACVGELFLVDRDTVDASNLNRQALAFESTVGRVKADVMREMVREINPRCRVECRQSYVTKESLPEVLAWAGAEVDGQGQVVGRGRLDYVVDAIDTITQKIELARLTWGANIPEVSSMGGANKLDPEKFALADISKTHGCRMARTIRRECSRRGVRHLEVLYSPEEPVRPRTVAGSSHGGLSNLGTASYMPPIMGQMVAGRVIRALIGYEPWRWDRGER
ncbi:tRNA threonylcarbamoyladenosine dehydratase [uncultured Parolsenella sp.]|uniref:tRNA threonylcarbamoyladenosine dehydratase n=1 Tax=uncultured Parolsenella sp. TaxID=2083008 RepID=UPI002599880A|nr:tRNA threonylcarbamoyladenosine dehydratase [uncultured Parolsenella sp.]